MTQPYRLLRFLTFVSAHRVIDHRDISMNRFTPTEQCLRRTEVSLIQWSSCTHCHFVQQSASVGVVRRTLLHTCGLSVHVFVSVLCIWLHSNNVVLHTYIYIEILKYMVHLYMDAFVYDWTDCCPVLLLFSCRATGKTVCPIIDKGIHVQL